MFNPVARDVPAEYPFPSTFSMGPLVDHWERMAAENPDAYGAAFSQIQSRLAAAPFLRKPIVDTGMLEGHEETIERLIQPVCSTADWLNDLRGLTAPLGGLVAYGSERFRKVVNLPGRAQAVPWLHDVTYPRMLYSYRMILRRFYDRELPVDQPLILSVPDSGGMFDRYYKLTAGNRFITVNARGAVPTLDDATLDDLMYHVDDMKLWMKHLPPSSFAFEGMSITSLVDVSGEIATASIKHILLTNETGVTTEDFEKLEHEIRTLFRRPGLRLGLATLRGDGRLNFASTRKIWNSLQIRDAVRETRLELTGSFYERAIADGRATTIHDLRQWQGDAEVVSSLLDLGVRSIMVVPLTYQGDRVGLLELTSQEPGDLQSIATLKVPQIEAVFALATHQNRERFEDRIQAVIRSTYTAIHPSVAWRFREAAVSMLERQKRKETATPEQIVFRNVYPVYGSADVRESSHHRNEAVRADMVDHLEVAHAVLVRATETVPFALAEELCRQIQLRLGVLRQGWGSSDETEMSQFVRTEINPLLDLLAAEHPQLAPDVVRYFAQTGIQGDTSAKRRGAYESSLRRINEVICDVLDEEQVELQQVFPHYYERFKTDGVDYTMYMGSSIAPERKFDHAFVRNLRLRQLSMCCKVAHRISVLRDELPMPLTVAQLVLAYSTPVTIRFRADERKFDVDGTQGVRFETVKKRIDKAIVRGTGERVTQPNKVAIIYSLEKEANEYARYVEFLQARGDLEKDVERLDLDDLPGVSGLKALRIGISSAE